MGTSNGREPEKLTPLLDETDQLIRIFVSSISTAEKRRDKK
jgi:hypothetical protein